MAATSDESSENVMVSAMSLKSSPDAHANKQLAGKPPLW